MYKKTHGLPLYLQHRWALLRYLMVTTPLSDILYQRCVTSRPDVVKMALEVIQAPTLVMVPPTNIKHNQGRVSRSSFQRWNAFKPNLRTC